ncbi:MAG: hypothetical protein WBA93_28300 [Microcoleaceae cyanobacterium]
MTTGPYKSKTLKYASEKHRQILDQSDRSFRHLKVAGRNTLQLLLYPIYVLLQASRLAVKQLQEKFVAKIPQISEKSNKKSQKNQTVDKAIQAIVETTSEKTSLAKVCDDQSKDRSGNEQPLPANIQQPKIFPIATSKAIPQSTVFPALKWEEKSNSTPEPTVESLFLVRRENQKIDNFTQEQQKQLQQNLIQETTNIHQNPQLQLKPCAQLSPTFGPIGKLWQVMAWVQTSKIALWFNLFGEVNLLAPKNQLKQQPLAKNQPITPLLSSSNFTFGNFIHNSAKQYLYPLTTGLGLNGLLPPFEIEKFPLDSILEEEMAKESQQMRSRSVVSAVLVSEPETFQKVEYLPTTAQSSQLTVTRSEDNKEIQGDENQYHEYQLTSTRETSQISPQSPTTESRPRYQPDWLEVNSVSIGYIKHPLEKILAWMDVIMNWLETAVAQLWRWAQKQVQNF